MSKFLIAALIVIALVCVLFAGVTEEEPKE